jgi:3-hydroxyisobutyrate dehydrogenase-like beta-hydroxyacid dehydrogenase
MAARLLACGHELVAWNRTPAAGEALAALGASSAARPEETLDTEIVITMLADDAAVEAVWITSGLIDRMPLSTVHLNMASVSLALAQRMTRLHGEGGAPYVAAPVFGRPQFAESGQLDIVAAGPRQAIARCTPLFEALGKQWFDIGDEPARANIVKIARNFLLGTLIESLGEAFALVGKSGVDPARFLEIITSTSFNAPAYKSYGRLMLEPPDKPTFTLTLGMKDIELALEAGGATRVPMPMAALIREQHLAAINRGYGDRDWAALGNYIARSAGL